MVDRYILLRTVRPRPASSEDRGDVGARRLGADREQARSSKEVTFPDLDGQQAAEVRRDPDNLLSRSMRTCLIRPTRTSPRTPPGSAWGRGAIGADACRWSGSGAVVAVLDTGIDRTHPAFAGTDIVECDFSGAGDGDRDGHGTHCCGTIFGKEVDGVHIGIAPGIRRALVGKVFGDDGRGSSQSIFDGMLWALRQGAHVVSMSLGFDFPGEVAAQQRDGVPIELATSQALVNYRDNLRMFDAIMDMFEANGRFGTAPLVVAASGNESRRQTDPNWRISASLPAASAHLSVAALGERAGGYEVAPFSNSAADIAAPGVDVLSAAPGGGYVVMDGTSMAAPHVAGAAALWVERQRSEKKAIDAPTLRSFLIASARMQDVTGDRSDVGNGMVRVPD